MATAGESILTRRRFPLPIAVFWAMICGALIPWFYYRVQQATNSDILWLCEATKRWLGGSSLVQSAYELNPPWTLLFYTPVVWLQTKFGLPLHYMVFYQSVALTIISAAAVFQIIRKWDFITEDYASVITAGFLLAETIGTSIFFGERDHIVALALAPFVLLQLSMTYHQSIPKGWKWPVLLVGALLIMLKPHHGLLPTILIIHRFFRERRFSILLDGDFVSLALAVIIYVTSITLLFPDWVNVIFPDALKFYLPLGKWGAIRGDVARIVAACIVIGSFPLLIKIEDEPKVLLYFFLGAALAGMIPYVIQGMGFYYHVMPTLGFLGASLGLIMFASLKQQNLPSGVPIVLAAAMLVTTAYLYTPLNKMYSQHDSYVSKPLSKMLLNCKSNQSPDKPCTFFMVNQDMGVIHETAYYTGVEHASRFPSFWFLRTLADEQEKAEKGQKTKLSEAELNASFHHFAGMVAEDLAVYKPDIIIVWTPDDKPQNRLAGRDFVDYFTQDKDFAKEWKHYKKDSRLELSYADYYQVTAVRKDMLKYDIYRRIPDQAVDKKRIARKSMKVHD